MATKAPIVIGASLLLLGAAAYLSIGAKQEEIHEALAHEHDEDHVVLTPEQLELNGVETSVAGPGTLSEGFDAPATIMIHSDLIAHVYPKVTGNVHQALKTLGDHVTKGEILGTLESKEIAEAKAMYLAMLKKNNLMRTRYQREKNLHEKNITAEQELHQVLHDWEESEINLELSRQKLYTLGMSEEELKRLPDALPAEFHLFKMRSPITGNVIKKNFKIGELLTPGNDAYVIADLRKVLVEFTVFPNELKNMKLGQKITLSCNQQSTEAEVIYIHPIVDSETHTAKAVAEIDNSNKEWIPGNFACALVSLNQYEVPLVVTKDAVQEIDGSDIVFVVANEGFEPRPVRLGRSDNRHVEVLAGLTSGETYASKNTFILKAELKKHEAEHMD